MKITISDEELKQAIKERIEDNTGLRVDESKIFFEWSNDGTLDVVVDMGATPRKGREPRATDEAPF